MCDLLLFFEGEFRVRCPTKMKRAALSRDLKNQKLEFLMKKHFFSGAHHCRYHYVDHFVHLKSNVRLDKVYHLISSVTIHKKYSKSL